MDPARRTPYSVVLRGEVDICVTAALGRLATDFETGAARDVHVDLSAVTFLDSSGLSFLARLLRATGERGGQVTVLGPSATVRRLLRVSGLAPLLVVAD